MAIDSKRGELLYDLFPESFPVSNLFTRSLEYVPVQNASYQRPWTFEQYDLTYWRLWFGQKWPLSIYISLVYLLLIFFGQLWMKIRPKYELRQALTIWNFGLAMFSLGGALRTWPEVIYIIQKRGLAEGLHFNVCRRDDHTVSAAFWGLLFTLSKAVELGDTFFIVARKQPLIFLHWYHHITVLGYTWYTYETYDSTSRSFMVMNYTVHALMYSYYGLKALRVRVPRIVSMIITTLQLSQMMLGLGVNLYSWYIISHYNNSTEPRLNCQVQLDHIHLALVMYASYFVLFLSFFYNAYFKRIKEAEQGAKRVVIGYQAYDVKPKVNGVDISDARKHEVKNGKID